MNVLIFVTAPTSQNTTHNSDRPQTPLDDEELQDQDDNKSPTENDDDNTGDNSNGEGSSAAGGGGSGDNEDSPKPVPCKTCVQEGRLCDGEKPICGECDIEDQYCSWEGKFWVSYYLFLIC